MRGAKQRGVVLVIALIMLAVVTLIGTVSANIVMGNLRVVQNIEAAAAARSNAASAIQETVSAMQDNIAVSGLLVGDSRLLSGCQGENNARCFDMTGDGAVDDMKVTLTELTCISIQPILTRGGPLSDEAWLDPNAARCWFDGGQYSPCADMLWDASFEAVDLVTGAKIRMRQGLTTTERLSEGLSACRAAGMSQQ